MSEEANKERPGKKIGLFGGTFNPIHLGHLRGAEEIGKAFDLQEVIFIPAALPPHKMKEKIIEACHRLKMVKLAIQKNPRFSMSDVELKRPGKSYSIDTLRYFREKFQDSLYFIVGRDAFVEIETWKDFQNLFSFCNFIIMTRPGFQKTSSLPGALIPAFQYDQGASAWVHVSGNRIFFKEITLLDISSTKIRELIEKGESIRYLVPPEVEAYIKSQKVYQKGRP